MIEFWAIFQPEKDNNEILVYAILVEILIEHILVDGILVEILVEF